jgi:hypothetical protein
LNSAALIGSINGVRSGKQGLEGGSKMNLFPGQLAFLNLQGGIEKDERGYMSKEEAIARLQELSGLGFGDDSTAWEAWVSEHYESVETMRRSELSPNKDE